jgi:hypothetical protein
MVIDMSMGPIAFAFNLFECDFGWFALAVLIFYPLWTLGLA